ncbi:MAG: tRNA (adenosine(37)-N6)-threonylcarbamoyltransferase complex dimerization subunit type 1 TsaB [Pirellulales bacterium]
MAIETSGRTGSLAALDGQAQAASCVREIRLDGGGRTAQWLAPALERLLAEIGWSADSIELVAVAVGPGSFTGLRIGVTAAKTLAYAVGAQIVAVETMAVLAAQAASPATLWTVMDAQRQELFVARFAAPAAGRLAPIGDTSIIAVQLWLDRLRPGDHVTGPPLARLQGRLPEGVVAVTPDECWQPTAAGVGQVAWQAYQNGQRDDVWTLVPRYYRPSAAEEKAARRT